MKEMFKRVVLVPIWIMTLILQPHLPENHPWKHQTLSLDWWLRGASHMAYQFSLLMGLNALGGLILFIWWILK